MTNLKRISETIYESHSGLFKLRTRKGRSVEVCFVNQPNAWYSTGKRTLDEAYTYSVLCVQKNRIAPRNRKVTLKEFAKDFFTRTDNASQRAHDEHFGKTKGEAYYAASQGRLNNYILPRFGKYLIGEIKPLEIERWYVDIEGPNGHRLASSSRIKILNTFSIVLDSAIREGIIDANPCDSVEKIPHVTENPRSSFTITEVKKMFPSDMNLAIRIWGSLKWATYFSIMVDTGFRAGEVAALQRSSFVGNGVYSKSSVNAFTKTLNESIKTTKKGQNYKVGTLSSYSLELVERYIATLPEDQELLFLSERGGLLTPEVGNKHLKSVLRKLEIPIDGRTQHCFRHFFDTFMLVNLGADVKEADIRELMAHTGYRPEYDHRTPMDIVSRLEKVRPVIEKIRA